MGENYFSCHWELQLPGEALPQPIGRKKEPGETCKNRRQGSGMMLLVLRGKRQVKISRFKVNYETLVMSVKNNFNRKLNIKVVLLSNIFDYDTENFVNWVTPLHLISAMQVFPSSTPVEPLLQLLNPQKQKLHELPKIR